MDHKRDETNSREKGKNGTSGAGLPASRPHAGVLKLIGIVVVATIILTLAVVWIVAAYIFPSELKPVTLSAREEKVLTAKINKLDIISRQPEAEGKKKSQPAGETPLKPERYSEDASRREIVLSERELNALLAKNTNLAKKLAIDLSGDLASMKLIIPLDKDLPVFGDKTLKVTAGLELAYAGGRPVVALKGISVWGVPLPNAWLGNLKNVDLVKEFGNGEGIWSSFAAGIDEVKVEEGSLRIRLKE